MNVPIYLDYQASTPLDPAVGAAMHPYLDGWVAILTPIMLSAGSRQAPSRMLGPQWPI